MGLLRTGEAGAKMRSGDKPLQVRSFVPMPVEGAHCSDALAFVASAEHYGSSCTSHETHSSIDPAQDSTWDALVDRSEGTEFFHTSCWPRVIQETYGHRASYLGVFNSRRVEALLPLIEVSSPWTGKRGVSLPFADVCPAIVPNEGSKQLFEAALEYGHRRGWRYLEWKNNELLVDNAKPSLRFHGHIVSLNASSSVLFSRLESAVRRNIRKAEQNKVQVDFTTDPGALKTFFKLHCQTRRRHGVPPQPFRFFENIGRFVLAASRGFVAIASLNAQPIAAAVFFFYRRTALYKFGASDYSFQHLRPNNLLMWRAIEHCKELGCRTLHLGRTSLGQDGLRRFKLSLGAVEQPISYYRYDLKREAFVEGSDRANSRLTTLFRILPAPMFSLAGKLLYPHLS